MRRNGAESVVSVISSAGAHVSDMHIEEALRTVDLWSLVSGPDVGSLGGNTIRETSIIETK